MERKMSHATALELLKQARDIIGKIETIDTEETLNIDIDGFIAAHSGIAGLESAIRDASWHEEGRALVCYRQRNNETYQGRVYRCIGGGYGACATLPNGHRVESDGVSLQSQSDAQDWVQREFDRMGVR
jgi:hypothetical protein